MNAIEKLSQMFAKFPGIGPRQSKRFVYFLLTRNQNYLDELAEMITTLKKDTRICNSCFRFFQSKGSTYQTEICSICLDEDRDQSILMIVSNDVDLSNIEKNDVYNGKYFVLGGLLPILEKNPEERIRSRWLLNKIEKEAVSKNIKEVILALSLNPEGENTLEYLLHILKPLAQKYSFKLSTLGRGLSTGTELEYSDNETLKNALQNRI